MIQANELRVVNWVEYKWFEKSYNPTRTTIHREYVQVLAIDSANNRVLIKTEQFRKNHTWVSLSKVSPIPLTEEILIKCGFKYQLIGLSYGRFNFTWKEKYKYWYVVDNESMTYLTKIEYLHELQNFIYIMDGKELEINL